jgi:hypothetical protein
VVKKIKKSLPYDWVEVVSSRSQTNGMSLLCPVDLMPLGSLRTNSVFGWEEETEVSLTQALIFFVELAQQTSRKAYGIFWSRSRWTEMLKICFIK